MSTERYSDHSYVDVPAVLAGTFLAIAIAVVFTHFGSAIGLSIMDEPPRWTGDDAWTRNEAIGAVMAAGLWVVWTQVTASMAGGYIAGRMRRPITDRPGHEREIRDGAHGLVVWATGTVAVAIAAGLAAAFIAGLDASVTTANEPEPVMSNTEHNAAIIFAFITAASSFVSAAVSWWAATMGGDHRDQNIDHSHYVSFRKR